MAKVVHCHVSINTVVGQFVGHDAPASVVDEDIETIGRGIDLLSGLLCLGPVAQVTLDPDDTVGLFLTKFMSKRLLGVADNVL